MSKVDCHNFLLEISKGTAKDKNTFTQLSEKADHRALKQAFYSEDSEKVFEKVTFESFTKLERRMNPRPMAPAKLPLNEETMKEYNFSKWTHHGSPSLIHAITIKNKKIAKYLIATGEMNLRAKSHYNTVLATAAWVGYYDIMNLIMDENSDTISDIAVDRPATILISLISTVHSGEHLDILERILKSGRANCGYANSKGQTALMIAASRSMIKETNMILEYCGDSVNIEAVNSQGYTAMTYVENNIRYKFINIAAWKRVRALINKNKFKRKLEKV